MLTEALALAALVWLTTATATATATAADRRRNTETTLHIGKTLNSTCLFDRSMYTLLYFHVNNTNTDCNTIIHTNVHTDTNDNTNINTILIPIAILSTAIIMITIILRHRALVGGVACRTHVLPRRFTGKK